MRPSPVTDQGLSRVCGICGAVQLSGTPRHLLATGELELMSEAMVHRGPDDDGIFRAPGVAFAARRLSIVDVVGGHQPFPNEDGTVWVAQNGELFNHEELRRGLEREGHRFRSRCDTEILPHLYERDGVDLASRLRGMFALVLWDESARTALLVRDRLGIKPLYYAVVGDTLLFASELKCLLASGQVDAALDYEAIDAYLTLGFFPSPRRRSPASASCRPAIASSSTGPECASRSGGGTPSRPLSRVGRRRSGPSCFSRASASPSTFDS